MRLYPMLARAAAHSIAHYVWSASVVATSLLYVLIPIAIHLQQAPSAQMIGVVQENTLPPTPESSRIWAEPDNSFQSVSVTSSPSFDSLVEPQQAQLSGAAITTRSRGRCSGNGLRDGRRLSNDFTVVARDACSAASSSSVAFASRSSS